MDYSVLMSVYKKETPEHLRLALNSMWDQTVLTNDFVLVCDGPLTEELEDVIKDTRRLRGNVFRVIKLEKNMGLGNALNVGIQHCKNELIARMDSDDISRPTRCEKQLKVFELFPEVGICSGAIEEFSTTIQDIEARRIPPETHEEIVEFAKKRCPFNHPCVMYKKSLVKAAGGYQDFYSFEDYPLWIRMLSQGVKGYNLQEPLLWMRAGNDMYKRRSGWKYAKSQIRLFKYMKEIGFIGNKQYVESCCIRVTSALAPNWLRKLLYRAKLRN